MHYFLKHYQKQFLKLPLCFENSSKVFLKLNSHISNLEYFSKIETNLFIMVLLLQLHF
jgi:hypothetical protein